MKYLEKLTFTSQKWKTLSRLSNHHNETPLPKLSRWVLGNLHGGGTGQQPERWPKRASGQEASDMSARPCVTQNRSQGSWRSLVSVAQGCTWEREKIRRRRGSAEGTRPHRRGGSLGEGGRGAGDERPLRPLRPGRRVLGVTELKPTSVALPGDAELLHGHCRWGQTDG